MKVDNTIVANKNISFLVNDKTENASVTEVMNLLDEIMNCYDEAFRELAK